MKKVELLAPCGSIEALKAAIINGADAVYLGGKQFGARAYASNFTNEELIKAIELAHLYNVKVYVTVNTLIYDHEFSEAMDYIDFLYHHDVDAVIVQDLGLMHAIREYYPDLIIHASTQMTVHNYLGAKVLSNEGIKRVVLARENTLEEIKYINENVDIETEVFVHGALCICYSGQCLMSSLIGGRSGNRGKCAQPCRRLYNLVKDGMIVEKNKYLLSPKDLNTIHNLDKIIEAGVTSLKIEGRMKSPEYVAIVVATYRKAIDSYYQKGYINISKQGEKDLTQIFNRGFTKGFMFQENGSSFINHDKNNNMGILCGVVEKVESNKVLIKCLENIHLNDGIYFDKANFGIELSRIIVNNDRVLEAQQGESLLVDVNKKVTKGDKVYKTKSFILEEKARKKDLKKIGIFFQLELFIGQKAKLIVNDDLDNVVELETDVIVERSINSNLSNDNIIKQMERLGNTPFYVKNIKINRDDNIFITISALNNLRRLAITELIAKRSKYHNRQLRHKYQFKKTNVTNNKEELVTLAVYCHTLEQFKAAQACGIMNIYVNEDLKLPDYEDIYVVQKRIIHENNSLVHDKVIIGDIGSLMLIDDKYKVITNSSFNVTNSEAIRFLENKKVRKVTFSLEANENIYKHLLYEDKSFIEVIVYGFQEMMESKYCHFFSNCQRQCKKGRYYLVDSLKEKFYLDMDSKCHMHIYNSKNLILGSEIKSIIKYGYRNFRLNFTSEDYEETLKVIKAYQELLYNNDITKVNDLIALYKQKDLYTKGYFSKDIL